MNALLTSIGLLKNMWPSIYKCFNYHKILDQNCTTLKDKIERLKCREQDVCTELQNAQYQRKKEKKEVENWLKEVQNMKDDVEKMEEEVRKQRCFSRLGFLRHSVENIEKVDELLERGRFPEGILIEVVGDEGKALLTVQLVGENTAKRNLEKIWKCLQGDGIQSLGVWGMGGIGKTTTVTHIHNLLLKEKGTFGSVYWVTVSKDSSIPKLQNAIAGKINLDLSEENDEKIRSALLFEALRKEKKFVVIFDDVWDVYSPREVGIPIGVVDGGGKLVITTRSREVCLKIGCKEIIKMEPLHKEEAWELFNNTLDRYNALSQKEEEIAKDIVKECGGLPLAIVTTARSMSIVYDIAEWRNALNELRGLVKGHTIDMENDVFKVLEFSYSRLNNEKLQECLLYCALFPEDCEIKRVALIRYWIAEGLVEEMGSRQAESDRGHAILNKLENVCLLERCDQNGKRVKMHDVVRDMAINITGRNSRFMVKLGRNLEEDLPSDQIIEWSNNLERVSLIDSRLSITSMSVPNCPKLSTLLLQKETALDSSNEGLPNSFFMHMVGSLRVLDLSFTSIAFLPDSIYDLVNLRALILYSCKGLKQVGSLAKLTELRELDFSWNEMETIPNGIEKLVKLKQFSWTTYRRGHIKGVLLPNPVSDLLPSLVHLQCLKFHDTRLEDVGVEELSGLRKLEILVVGFSGVRNFNSYVRKQHYQRLTHYHLQLSRNRESYNPYHGLSKKVIVQNCRLIGGKEKEKEKENDEYQQLVLPANLRVLEISRCELLRSGGVLDVSPTLKTAMDLKACKILYCEGIEYVWWADDCIASSLNTLYIQELPKLRVLFKLRPRPRQGPTENIVNCSSSLKHLFVGGCNNLKHLFTAELVKDHLQSLHSIFVYDCRQLEDIIIVAEPEPVVEAAAAAAEVEEDTNEMDNDLTILRFPNLQILKLAQLPKLKSIWKRYGKVTCDSLQQLSVRNCPKLQRLPLSMEATTNGDGDGERKASSPPLKEIRGEKEWWDEVEWEPKSLFQSLFIPLEWRHSGSWVSIILFYTMD